MAKTSISTMIVSSIPTTSSCAIVRATFGLRVLSPFIDISSSQGYIQSSVSMAVAQHHGMGGCTLVDALRRQDCENGGLEQARTQACMTSSSARNLTTTIPLVKFGVIIILCSHIERGCVVKIRQAPLSG